MNWGRMEQVGSYRKGWESGKSGDGRESDKYKQWRKRVKRINGKKCAYCGIKKGPGVVFHVHHIERWADKEKTRFKVNNGVCLCKFCHDRIHGYKGKPPDLEMTEVILQRMISRGIKPAVRVVEKRVILRKRKDGGECLREQLV